jgi:cytosine/adenosine deaminase-related metal-dependent hydrolase
MAESRRLLAWLTERIWPLEASHTPDTMAVSVILGLRELFSSGCCALLDMGSVEHSPVTARILRESGARALLGNALMDVGPSFIAKPLSWLQDESISVRRMCGDRLRYAFTPRFVLSCSRELWNWLADEDASVHRSTHSSEATAEMADPAIRSAGGNVHLLRELGFLGNRTILAHCVHLMPGELEALSRTGTAVAHCPWANLKLGSGMADVPAILGLGIGVLVGSDGAACNNGLDVSSDLRLAMGLSSLKGGPEEVAGEKWFSIASRESADYLGFGMEDDSVELSISQQETDELCSCEDPWRYILELPWRNRVVKLTCGGAVLYEEGVFPTLPPLPLSTGAARSRVLDGLNRLA